MELGDRFEPSLLSIEENQFIADHAGESPQVAFRKGLPEFVNKTAVQPVLQKIYDLEEMQRVDGVEWAGVDAVKQACTNYLVRLDGWVKAKKRGIPYPPTMFEWNSRGRALKAATGADIGVVKTYFDDQGARQDLGVDFQTVESAVPDWVTARKAEIAPTALTIDDEKGIVTCPICGHNEIFEPDQPSKKNMALARMSRHLVKAKTKNEEHRILHGLVSGT